MLYVPGILSFQDVSFHFQGKKKKKRISLLKILALEQECFHSPYRKQLSVPSLVSPGSWFAHHKTGGGQWEREKVQKKVLSLQSSVFFCT